MNQSWLLSLSLGACHDILRAAIIAAWYGVNLNLSRLSSTISSLYLKSNSPESRYKLLTVKRTTNRERSTSIYSISWVKLRP